MLKEVKYPSKDNLTEISAYAWIPDGKIKAILQIEHGMVEHITRYEKIAEIFNSAGILVCGDDHLGHGLSVVDKDHYGYIAKKRGDLILVDDAHSLTQIMKKDYPNVPYFLLGHSFGSFIVRNYIKQYDKDIDGLIIMGSSYYLPLKLDLGICLTAIDALFHGGWFHRSKSIRNLTTGKLNKTFEENETFSWLTRNKEALKSYEDDPYCQFAFTDNAYLNMFRLIKKSCLKSTIKNTNKNLPILIFSGKDDPIGDFGKSVVKMYNFYKNAKFQNIELKLYNNMRHEVFSEPERVIVLNDITSWINNNN